MFRCNDYRFFRLYLHCVFCLFLLCFFFFAWGGGGLFVPRRRKLISPFLVSLAKEVIFSHTMEDFYKITDKSLNMFFINILLADMVSDPWFYGFTCTAQSCGERHPQRASRVLQALTERFPHQGQGAVLVPHRQPKTQHAPDDAVLLICRQEPLLVGQVHHEGHVDVDRLSVKQSWQYSLQLNKLKEKGETVRAFYISKKRKG